MKRPGRTPFARGEKAKDFKGTVYQLAKYMGRYKIALVVALLFAVGSAVFSIVGPKILGNATTEIYTGLIGKITGGAGIDFVSIANILLWLLAIYVISALCGFVQGFLMSNVAQKISYRMRDDISKKINRMPMRYFESKTHGEVLSRVTNDVDTLSQSLNQSLTQLISSITMIIGVLVMMLTISWAMTLVALVLLPISMILVSLIVKRSQKYFAGQQKYLGQVNGHVEEIFSGHLVMKAFNGEEDAVKQFDEYNSLLYKSAWKSQFFSGIMMPLMTFVGNLGYVGVSILGGVLAIQGSIDVGSIQAFIQYVRSFTQPISQIAQITNLLQSTAAAAERVFEFLDEEEEEDKEPEKQLAPVSGSVTFEHVSFGYLPGQTIIHDFNASVQPGQKIAIVGPTGAGKTTMIKLLMRFYDVDSGVIKIDGKNIRDYSRNDLRSFFGMVLQDTWLFHGSIMENIRYGRLTASDSDVMDAAKAAFADHFIRTLPEGYQTELNEEATNVSQGQKQLLTIARAILADPKILILDEATSSVDTRTEIRIQKAMDRLMEGRTSFIIAHRLSTIRDADLILVMKDGDIVEQGKHEDLLKKGGFYASLYNAQFEKAVS